MAKGKIMKVLGIIALIGLIGVPMQAQGVVIDTGLRSTEDGVTAGGNWGNGFVIQWSITNEGSLGYTYTYSFTSDGETPLVGQPSHFIIEVSLDAPNALYKVGETYLAPQWWESSSSNPGMPGDDIYGIKLDFGSDSYSFESTQAPMWGDFYAKDGQAGGRGWNYAYNTGFGTDPIGSTTDFSLWIRVPDTTTKLPEPGTALLLGAGLVLLGGLKRRSIR